MSMRIRKAVAERIAELVEADRRQYLLRNLPSIFEIRKSERAAELHLPVIKTRNLFEKNGATLIKQIVDAKYDDRIIKEVSPAIKEKSSRAPIIVFKLNPVTFIEEVLSDSGKYSSLENAEGRRGRRKIVVEFSSPNIAKPFHVGHLRSTIIGNFIANLHQYSGDDVVRMNYLGDWGTQFGMLQMGLEMTGVTDEDLKASPIQTLYKIYVLANQAAKTDPAVAEGARKAFALLEGNQDSVEKQRWEKIRQYTVDELRSMYQRLGVEFDEYSWESQYSQKDIQDIVSLLLDRGILLDESDGKKVVQVGDRRVPVMKSDGSTLYLARDIAALLDRFRRHNFDKIFYVVDNAQTDHFKACFDVVNQVQDSLITRTSHIKFGRIKGMSTRSGNVVFLKDILDEARDVMMQKQIQSTTTKLDIENLDPGVADILGVSAVVVNDLKQRRQRDYDFNWDKALQVNGDTGIKLQYTHCRLCSLMEGVGIDPAPQPNPACLTEPEALDLVTEIARFPEIISRAEDSLEACVLVSYLFSLSNSISRALKQLNVKNESCSDVQTQRMLLFVTAKEILYRGMTILGLKPLSKM